MIRQVMRLSVRWVDFKQVTGDCLKRLIGMDE